MCFLEDLYEVIESRKESAPEGSYVVELLSNESLLLEKIGEEAVELILATKSGEDVVHEASDLLFHTLVVLSASDHSLREVEEELRSRHENG
ncbi:MAG: Phosphoribosyl-ATP pyrophosphatase [Methanonatronarchaeales archaeon]|nr:Phosphoribosyl-ATP pyrophosphatase [Methanonatronarchaeales archaeon]